MRLRKLQAVSSSQEHVCSPKLNPVIIGVYLHVANIEGHPNPKYRPTIEGFHELQLFVVAPGPRIYIPTTKCPHLCQSVIKAVVLRRYLGASFRALSAKLKAFRYTYVGPVASLGGGGADRPGWHPPGGDTRGKKLWANLQRIVEKRGRTGKKGVGWHPRGGDTRVKAIKSDSDNDSDEQKWSPGFSGKNIGVTPSVAAPGLTHASDATVSRTD